MVLAASMCLMQAAVAATKTRPVASGTQINNTVVVSYMVSGHRLTQTAHNTFVVDQLIDVSATWQNGNPVQAPAGASDRSLLFKVGNDGNGTDSYALTLHVAPGTPDGFAASQCRPYLDNDHDGTYSHGDTAYPAAAHAPAVPAGDSLDIVVACNIPANAGDQALSHIQLIATSNTLSGQPGDSKPAGGHGGVVVVVGVSGGKATTTGTYLATNVNYTFTSTQLVTDRSGGHIATSGSRITYTLTVAPKGAATGRDLMVDTPIPAHTTYVPHSLQLDGVHLSDNVSDADAGMFNSANHSVRVRLGDVPGSAAPHHIRFQVTIN
jgi:uncharacterized repeat protein (TIGR01451 family)